MGDIVASFRHAAQRFALPLSVVCVSLAILALSPRIYYALTHETTDDAYVDSHAVTVSARVTGTVSAIMVNEGQAVRRGGLIAQLDDTNQQIELLRAQQNLAIAKASLAQAQADAQYARAQKVGEGLRAQAMSDQSVDRATALRMQARSAESSAQASLRAVVEAQARAQSIASHIPAAKTELQNAASALRRAQSLQSQGYVAPASVELAQNQYAEAGAALATYRAQLAEARANIDSIRQTASAGHLQAVQASASASAEQLGTVFARSNEIENSGALVASKEAAVYTQRAQIEAARQAVRLASYELSQTRVVSPIDGFVASRTASLGQTLQTGDAIAMIVPSKEIYVTANFKETQLKTIEPGAAADIHVDAYPKLKLSGRVQSIGAASQSAFSLLPNNQITGNFVKITERVPVRVEIIGLSPEIARRLRSGMSVEVSIPH